MYLKFSTIGLVITPNLLSIQTLSQSDKFHHFIPQSGQKDPSHLLLLVLFLKRFFDVDHF